MISRYILTLLVACTSLLAGNNGLITRPGNRIPKVHKFTSSANNRIEALKGMESKAPSIFKGAFEGMHFPAYRHSAINGSKGVLLGEGFEGAFPPSGWVLNSTNTGDSTWHKDTRWVSSGTYSSIVWWSFTHQDEWLITPEVILTGSPNSSYVFDFSTYAHKGSTYGDHYYVLISTDHQATWDTLLDIASFTAPDTGWTDTVFSFDLSAYANDTIAIAFNATDNMAVGDTGLWYIWGIDDIEIRYPSQHDVAALAITSPADTLLTPDVSVDLRASFYNPGLSEDTFNVTYQVDSEGINIFQNTINISLASGAQTDTFFGTWTPHGRNIHYSLTAFTSLATDEDNSNDTVYMNVLSFDPHHGGPDNFYYTFVDNDAPDGPTFAWIDANTGTPITLDDDDTTTIDLPFDFPFYTSKIRHLVLSSNGFLAQATDYSDLSNEQLPDPDKNNLIAMWWDDLNPSAQGNIYYYVAADSSYVIIEFDNIVHYGQTAGNTFEVILYPDGNILLQYMQVDASYAASSTIGIQGGTGEQNNYLQYTYNGYPLVPHNGLAILYKYPVFNHDYAVTAIDSLPEIIDTATSLSPMALVRNFGINQETNVPVVMDIMNNSTVVWTQSINVSLDSARDTAIAFGPTPILSSAMYTFSVHTELSGDERPNNDTFNVSVGVSDKILDFESGPDLFKANAGWQWADVSADTAGPASGYSGTHLVGTIPNGDYEDDANYTLDRRFVVTSDSAYLVFAHYYDTEKGYDGANVKISTDGTTFTLLSPVEGYADTASDYNAGIPGEPCFSGHDATWRIEKFPVTGLSGDTVIIRWQFGSDASVDYPGWYIDDVAGIGMSPLYYQHDILVQGIPNPPVLMHPNTYYIPEVVVDNVGLNTENFLVVTIIDSEGTVIDGHTNSVSLSPFESQHLYLDPLFTHDVGVTYHITAKAMLADDNDTTDNLLVKTLATFLEMDTINIPYSEDLPQFDGNVDAKEWSDAVKVDISDVYGKAGTSMPPNISHLYLKVDTTRYMLYVAVKQCVDSSYDDYDQIGLFFDENNDGSFPSPGNDGEGNYWVVYHPQQDTFSFRALHNDGSGSNPVVMNTPFGIGKDTDGYINYEVSIPLGTDNSALSVVPGDTMGMFVYNDDESTGYFYAWWPQSLDMGNWNQPSCYGKVILPEWTDINEHNDKKLYKLAFGPVLPNIIKGNSIVLHYSVPSKQNVVFSFYDVQGRMVNRTSRLSDRGMHTLKVDTKLPDGVYFVNMQAGKKNFKHRFIIAR